MSNIYIKAILLTLLSMVFTLQSSNAQSCRGFEKKCQSAPKYFEASSLSRSITMRKARKTIINQTFYGNREYFISVCGKRNLGKIHFRLIADDESQSVLYDNAIENFMPTQLFVIQNTMKVKIEITAPHYFDDMNSACAGVQVYYNRSGN